HHRLDRAFGGGVVRMPGLSALTGGAPDEDGVPQASAQQLPHEIEGGVHVHPEHLFQRGGGDARDRRGAVDPGRMHQQMHLAEPLASSSHGLDAALLDRKIGANRNGSLRRWVRAVLASHAHALLQKGLCDPAADSAGSPGHQGRAPGEVRIGRKHCPFFAHMVQVGEVLEALIIFVATYIFLAGTELPFLKLDRPGGAVAGAVAMVALGVLTPEQVYRDAISWDTLVLLLGMMVITSVMARAGIFRWIAWVALRRAHGPRAVLAVLVLVAGGLSALLVNDTVCVMCTPLVLALVEAAALPPLPYLLGLAFASNAGSVATLTGNPQNMLIGTLSGIAYAQFGKALLLFFEGLLWVVHGVAQAGIAERIHGGLGPLLGSDAPQQAIRFGLFSAAACQLVARLPFVLLAAHWVPMLAEPRVICLSLALV